MGAACGRHRNPGKPKRGTACEHAYSLITGTGHAVRCGRARFVDVTSPTKGAATIDVSLLVVLLAVGATGVGAGAARAATRSATAIAARAARVRGGAVASAACRSTAA